MRVSIVITIRIGFCVLLTIDPLPHLVGNYFLEFTDLLFPPFILDINGVDVKYSKLMNRANIDKFIIRLRLNPVSHLDAGL